MLDQLPAWLRHLVIAVLPVVLAEASSTWIPYLQGRFAASAGMGVLVTFLALIVTTLTKQYGYQGRGRHAQDGPA